jgi:hypothetical protein
LGKWKLLDDVAADAGVPSNQQPQDLDSSRVADGFAEESHFLVGLWSFRRAQIGLVDATWRGAVTLSGGCHIGTSRFGNRQDRWSCGCRYLGLTVIPTELAVCRPASPYR